MVKYDVELMKSDEGKALYDRWLRIRSVGCCQEWENDFMAFVRWAIDSGFEIGAHIKRYSKAKDYSPHNCYWSLCSQKATANYKATAFCSLWNKTVNRIREHYGMMLFDVNEPDFTGKTCKDCVHYKVCKYKKDDSPICEDFLD